MPYVRLRILCVSACFILPVLRGAACASELRASGLCYEGSSGAVWVIFGIGASACEADCCR